MYDQNDPTDPQVNALVSGICRLASCTTEDTATEQRELVLHETLQLAYKLEDKLNRQAEKINYLDRLAMTDSLTGILNRRGFQSELQRVLASARRYDETGVLAYIDLDGFKPINDEFGHACGDEALCHVARILERMTRGMDYIARLGGDEFAVLLVRTAWHDGEKRIGKISGELNKTILHWQDKQVLLRASVGVQFYDKNSLPHDLINAADHSMYAAKKSCSLANERLLSRDEEFLCTLNAAQ